MAIRPAGSGLLRLYPPEWRRRYEDEVAGILAEREVDLGARFDLLRGSIDAWLHPRRPSRVPAMAAFVGGGAWTAAGAFVVAQPVPPDWPGYLVDVLPLMMLGVGAILVATIGLWLRLGDGAGPWARIALDLAIAGHVVWWAALGAALIGADYGLTTVIASTAAALASVAVGACLLRAGDERVGVALVVTPVALLLTTPGAWLAYGLGWAVIGWLQSVRSEPLVPA